MERRRSSVKALIMAVSAVSLCFLAAVLYFELAAMKARRQADGALRNAVPSVEKLMQARSALRKVDGLLDHTLIAAIEGDPVDASAIAASRRALDAALAAYRALPFYDGEQGLNQALSLRLRELDVVMGRYAAMLRAKDVAGLYRFENREWRRASDLTDDALRRLTAFNVKHAAAHALEVDAIWRRAAFVGICVGVLSLVVTVLATVSAARSIRGRIRYEEERSAELEMFAARVAHDLMSPLGAIALAMGSAEKSADPAAGEWFRRSRAALHRVQHIVNGLLEFARCGGHMERESSARVGEVVNGVLEEIGPQASAGNIAISCGGAGDGDAEVRCSPGVLTVLLSNLLRNAIKFMGDSPIRTIRLTVRRRADRVRFEVEDSGPGLPRGFAAKAFEPYVRAKAHVASGLGLGLATVKKLVEAHRGQVGVDEERASGALVWFELPRLGPPTSAAS